MSFQRHTRKTHSSPKLHISVPFHAASPYACSERYGTAPPGAVGENSCNNEASCTDMGGNSVGDDSWLVHFCVICRYNGRT